MASMYHTGELSVQERAGVREMAARIGRSIGYTIPPAARNFLGRQPIVVVGSVDAGQRVWASLLTGFPGFLRAVNEHTVRINARPAAGDPLGDNLAANSQVGLSAIEFATRRRMRLNGRAEVGTDGTITIHAQQVYSNCPKYIQSRIWKRRLPETNPTSVVRRQSNLAEEQQGWIREADTFFIASHHPEGGTDASHRGGHPGFVRVLNSHRLVWPDYAGNTMFQTLGNIAVNPRAGLLFVDFEKGRTLQLTGRARIIWDQERTAESPGAERLVEFDVDQAVEIAEAHPLEWRLVGYSPENPA
ncbi:MAG TPA: pyridoxamine 5'-phosphate oxidase family protein [Terriglobia bacterium]|nr:pyridoxamine 5'-phosphate oxidase family protein [Terriglobia bacterium]